MKSRIHPKIVAVAAVVALLCALAPAASVLAGPKYYGTGIHLWVLHCPGSNEIMKAGSICPHNPPPECYCQQTLHDFPVDHIYTARVQISGGGEGGGGDDGNGTINVVIDHEEAIQCGVAVEPRPADDSCGAPFRTEALDEWDVAPEIREAVEERLEGIQEYLGHPVETILYSEALPLDG